MTKSFLEKIVVVSGGSSGIGRATALRYASMGATVYELSRSGQDTDGIVHITCDITVDEQVREAITMIGDKHSRIDILVNNAGFGISGAIEHTPVDKAKRQFDVNFFGLVSINYYAMKYLRESQDPRIINVSSVAGVAPIPFQAYYSATKSAINTYTLALHNEVKRYGIKVTSLMPGDIHTGFTDAREKIVKSEGYGDRIDKSIEGMERDEQNGKSPDFIAKKIVSLSTKRRPPLLCSAGVGYRLICLLLKILPTRFGVWVIGKLY